MPRLTLALAIALAVPLAPALAQAPAKSDPHAHHAMPDAKAPAANKASGVVKRIDPAKGTVTIAHGPVPELKWPAMTMPFQVKDKALFDKLAVDRKIEFEFVQQGSASVLTAVK